ncbi:MAG: hypothetical protein OER22_14565 [Gammaproteobacteria bacterium]|nr:hypothetical protein [Gammaproteobacteria bacterium]MDH3374043.1 hypothetical protein [Gammaproteobacteria bacterium]MDH3409809.1 hypothetical protein [Gammaproteobacteria bacterium]MDH3553833.1 hypothetical protein [Gammaproteobacteria bacterium]
MTQERNTTEPGAETNARLTQTYRELAHERVPDHLDRAVLQAAAKAARPRYSRLRSWTRPMAWAATVMLSVALVLQISDVPGPESIIFDDAARKFEAQVPQPEARSDAPGESADAVVLEEAAATAPIRSLNDVSDAPRVVAPASPAAKQVIQEPLQEKRRRSELRQDSLDTKEPAAPATPADSFTLRDADMLRRADEMARTQSGENKEPALPSSRDRAGTLSATAMGFEAPACDETATKSPESWLECIAGLEEAGLHDEAQQQRQLLQETFPDFQPR